MVVLNNTGNGRYCYGQSKEVDTMRGDKGGSWGMATLVKCRTGKKKSNESNR